MQDLCQLVLCFMFSCTPPSLANLHQQDGFIATEASGITCFAFAHHTIQMDVSVRSRISPNNCYNYASFICLKFPFTKLTFFNDCKTQKILRYIVLFSYFYYPLLTDISLPTKQKIETYCFKVGNGYMETDYYKKISQRGLAVERTQKCA